MNAKQALYIEGSIIIVQCLLLTERLGRYAEKFGLAGRVLLNSLSRFELLKFGNVLYFYMYRKTSRGRRGEQMLYENDMQNIHYPLKCAIMRGNLPFMTHCHQEVEIILLRAGTVKVYYEEEEYRLHKGDIWIVPPFASHRIGTGSEDCERLAILLKMKLMGTWSKEKEEWLWLQNELKEVDMFSGHWLEETRERILEIVENIYQEYCEKPYAWQLAVKSLINGLVLEAVRQMPRREKALEEKQVFKLKNILEYIALHYCENITLRECADDAGFNSAYLSRYFREHMGITFQEYVKRLRIEQAKWLLMTERISITEIGYQSGFRDVKTFNKLFKQECGKTPTEFRKSMIQDQR